MQRFPGKKKKKKNQIEGLLSLPYISFFLSPYCDPDSGWPQHWFDNKEEEEEEEEEAEQTRADAKKRREDEWGSEYGEKIKRKRKFKGESKVPHRVTRVTNRPLSTWNKLNEKRFTSFTWR
eukprot:TRINITY_DN7876_c0_g1_i2.p1 TRINITY_DN7876_c0_g1~~TRINITY_DN7876_c0_g1_i2.p1  ORF type:complete len:121 (-),score=13.01 TRINITY_DN7876_c0_g1_i2:177-539(-)